VGKRVSQPRAARDEEKARLTDRGRVAPRHHQHLAVSKVVRRTLLLRQVLVLQLVRPTRRRALLFLVLLLGALLILVDEDNAAIQRQLDRRAPHDRINRLQLPDGELLQRTIVESFDGARACGEEGVEEAKAVGLELVLALDPASDFHETGVVLDVGGAGCESARDGSAAARWRGSRRRTGSGEVDGEHALRGLAEDGSGRDVFEGLLTGAGFVVLGE